MMGAVDWLKNIGCPYYENNLKNPPCQSCRLFDKCSETLSTWENHYCNLIDQVAKDGFGYPLYMYYRESRSKLEAIAVFHPTSKVIIKCTKLKDTYNVATAYCYMRTGFLIEKASIEKQALKGTFIYCTYDTWEEISPKARVKIRNTRKRRLKPYKRASKQGWRKYLEEYQEERKE